MNKIYEILIVALIWYFANIECLMEQGLYVTVYVFHWFVEQLSRVATVRSLLLLRSCDVSCNNNYEFSTPTPNAYTCGPQGAFNVHNYFLGFRFPACGGTSDVSFNAIQFL